jgi:hypothetical protein
MGNHIFAVPGFPAYVPNALRCGFSLWESVTPGSVLLCLLRLDTSEQIPAWRQYQIRVSAELQTSAFENVHGHPRPGVDQLDLRSEFCYVLDTSPPYLGLGRLTVSLQRR